MNQRVEEKPNPFSDLTAFKPKVAEAVAPEQIEQIVEKSGYTRTPTIKEKAVRKRRRRLSAGRTEQVNVRVKPASATLFQESADLNRLTTLAEAFEQAIDVYHRLSTIAAKRQISVGQLADELLSGA